MQYELLFDYLRTTEQRILEELRTSDLIRYFNPEDVRDSVFSYINRPAKRLRPSVLLMAAGALGGNEREQLALPAAAGIELFHTWTLVHDDLIDNDRLRRGGPTVHAAMQAVSSSRDGLSDQFATEYGRDVAVLTGDVQHGWAVASFAECALRGDVDPILALKLIRRLQSYVLDNLVYGEVLDVRYGMHDVTVLEGIGEDEIVEMLWLKTGVLYEFAGMAGALIGKNTSDFDDGQVQAVTSFASKCGTAFQLQDDILGILGDEASLGKPVGSDIREGKKTVIVYEALKKADTSQRTVILSTLGNRQATSNEVETVSQLLQDLGGIRRTQELAARYINEALPYLEPISDSNYKDLLLLWAHYMLDREF